MKGRREEGREGRRERRKEGGRREEGGREKRRREEEKSIRRNSFNITPLTYLAACHCSSSQWECQM